jgi:hypothetical protein
VGTCTISRGGKRGRWGHNYYLAVLSRNGIDNKNEKVDVKRRRESGPGKRSKIERGKEEVDGMYH